MSQFEVELRGPVISPEEYIRVEELLRTQGTFVREEKRIIVDYSTFLDGGVRERTLDIRARVTNGEPEMIIKRGSWGGDEVREEVSVPVHRGKFFDLLRAYALLGYTKGILIARKSRVYTYNDTEIVLVTIPNHSSFFEAERIVQHEAQHDAARAQLEHVVQSLGLTTFSDEEWFTYLETLNREANGIYDANEGAQPILAALEQIDMTL
jgi:adenylate cyclase class IV